MKSNSKYIKLIASTFICALAVGLLSACEEVSTSIPGGAKAIVEAYLIPNKPITLKVKKEIAYSEDLTNKETFIAGLSIKVTGSDGTSYALKPFQDTLYVSESNVKLKVGVTYNLSFDYNGKNVSASTIIPTKPVGIASDVKSIVRTRQVITTTGGFGRNLDDNVDVNLSWTNPNNEYHFVVADNIEPNLDLVVTLPTSSSTTVSDFNRRFRSQPVQGTATRLRSQEFQYFGRYNIVVLKVNPDYAALYNTSGTTSQNISTPPTTITNGLGIFTGVNADTLSFLVKER
ncbi:hypothetical protein LV89_02685 [Arcicella aurantiaca]|uniref:DUF4249 family protein n=1 Tax=Arcicella aurantiaca TaxID=591202 RepID=A0A316E700_9BACT|nr:hypothetical protein [Arcicella aurantiaca]PWK26204.1 hypothetical protein LV89_02685 [Arcicella aurantiaca]